MRPEQTSSIIDQLRSLAKEAIARGNIDGSFEIQGLAVDLDRWVKAGGMGDPPVSDEQLAKLGVVLDAAQATPEAPPARRATLDTQPLPRNEAEAVAPAAPEMLDVAGQPSPTLTPEPQAPTDDPAEADFLKALLTYNNSDQPPSSLPSTNGDAMQAQKPRVPLITPASLDTAAPDDTLQTQLEQGVIAMRNGDPKLVARLLQEVEQRGNAQQRDQARTTLYEARREQNKREMSAVAAAVEFAQRSPAETERQRALWVRVTEVAEETSENYLRARNELARIEHTMRQTELAEQTRRSLRRIATSVRSAVIEKDLPALTRHSEELKGLRNDDLPPDLAQELNALIDDAAQTLQDLRNKTGYVSTLLQQNNTEDAYKAAVSLADNGFVYAYDQNSGQNRLVNELLNEAASRLVEFRKGKAAERVTSAEQIMATSPRRAVELFSEALYFLSYLELVRERRGNQDVVVSGSDRLPTVEGVDVLSERRVEVERELDRANAIFERWERAYTAVREAEQLTEPRDALGRLRSAELLLNQQPRLELQGLEAMIARREEEVASGLALRLEAACRAADAALIRSDYEAARTILSEASAQAESRDVQSPNARLEGARQQVAELTARVNARERRALEIGELVKSIEAALVAAPPDTDLASALLAQLADDERRTPVIVALASRISRLQSADEQRATARGAYAEQNWQLAADTYDFLVQGGGQHVQEAAQLGGRARAMLRFGEGAAFEQALPPNIPAARQSYSEAVSLFQRHSVDAQTEPAQQEASKRIKQIDDLLLLDATVMPEIGRLRALVDATRQTAEQELAADTASLAPRPEWRSIEARLRALAAQPSARRHEIEQLRVRVFDAWRDDYLKRARKAARASANTAALHALLAELQDANLLLDPRDQRLAREVELDQLLATIAQERGKPQPQWATVEQLEQQVLELCRLGYRPQAEGDWSEAALQERLRRTRMNKLRAQVNLARARGTTDQAVALLERELASDSFVGDVELTVELVKIYLDIDRFDDAYRLSGGMRFLTGDDTTRLGNLWKALTRAAELLSQQDYGEAITQIDYAQQTFPDYDDSILEWLNERVGTLVEALVRQAALTRRQDVAGAVQLYAQAQQVLDKLGRSDPRVSSGLTSLSSAIAKEIDTYCQRAEALALANRQPPDVIKEGRRIGDRLRAMQAVEDQLQLDDEQRDQLAATLEDIDGRIERWDRGYLSLSEARDLCEQARQKDWNFDLARQRIRDAQRDEDYRQQAGTVVRQIDEYSRWVNQLLPFVDQIDNAVRGENFDETISLCDQLNEQWTQMLRALPLPLDERGLREQRGLQHIYPLYLAAPQETISDWRKHRQIARELKANFELWRAYVESALRMESQTRTILREADTAKEQQTLSLRELGERYKACRESGERLGKLLAEGLPAQPPQSLRSVDEQERLELLLKRAEEHTEWHKRADDGFQECQQQLAGLDPILKTIDRMLTDPSFKNTVPNNNMLAAKIKQAQAIDAYDNEVQMAQQRLAQRRQSEKKGGGLFG